MSDILHLVNIEAEPARVYEALTEQAGLSSWWIKNTQAEPRVGAIDVLIYGGQFAIKLEVAELVPDKRVVWHHRQSVPEWEGTYMTWELTPTERGTKVLFGHHDYTAELELYAFYNYMWAVQLTSLKAYLETGKGNPES